MRWDELKSESKLQQNIKNKINKIYYYDQSTTSKSTQNQAGPTC